MSTITPTNFWASQTIYASQDPGTSSNTNDPDFNKSPTALAADTFRTWTREKQLAYLDKNGGTATIGPEKGEQIKAKVADRLAVAFTVSAGATAKRNETTSDGPGVSAQWVGALDANGVRQTADFDKAADKLDPRIFMSWRAEDQLDYLKAKSVTAVGGTLTIGAAGSDMGSVKATLVKDVAITGDLLYFTGNAADLPYTKLPGSAGGVSSLSLMPSPFLNIDGVTGTLPAETRPDGFDTDPSKLTTTALQEAFLKNFTNWHSAFQVEYARNWGVKSTVPVTVDGNQVNKDVFTLKIPNTTTPLLTAVTSATEAGKLYLLESLDKAAFAKMPKEDQVFIATSTATKDIFASIAKKVGLASVGDVTVPKPSDTTVKVDPAGAVADLLNYISTKASTNKTVTEFISPAPNPAPVNYSDAAQKVIYEELKINGFLIGFNKKTEYYLPVTDQTYFNSQVNIINEQLGMMGVVSPAELSKKLTELKERFDRAFAFWDVKVETKTPSVYYKDGDNQRPNGGDNGLIDSYKDVISLDGNQIINNGYRIFIAQEKRISELAEERMKLVRNGGTLFGKKLDVPELVYRFQSLYNLQIEAQVVMETEEVNQQNAMLKTYAAAQDVVNRTLSKFAKADEDGRYVLGWDISEYNKLSESEKKILSMFEDRDGTGQKHPLETLRKIDRPKEDIFNNGVSFGDSYYDLTKKTHLQWSQFGTRLSETVTIINQNSQIKMNDINSMDKQRNRHFELANSALSKMSEMVNNIARAG